MAKKLPAPLKRLFNLSPAQTITLSFAAMILVGAVLLNLPAASQSGQSVGFLNALFTATSANCVTGLVVVNTAQHWTAFGHLVIIVLIQLGGLGLVAILAVGMVLLRRHISLKNRITIQASFNQEDLGGMVRLVRHVIAITLGFEAIGALLLAAAFYFTEGMPLATALKNGLFHSISAFCNAGFDILGPSSLEPYQGNYFLLLVIMVLIVSGGLGFTVWGELLYRPKRKRRRPLWLSFNHLSLHSKLAILTTAGLILLGGLLFLLLEWSNPLSIGTLPTGQKILNSFFQSVTLRTAGFDSIGQAGLTEASSFSSSLLMLVGGSPASTAGGMKTVTLAIVLVSMLSVLRGRGKLEVFGRSLPLEILQKALSVIGAVAAVVLTATMVLHFTEQNTPFDHSFLDLLFECASATGTVGITRGITPYLSSAGKGVICLCMFLGRLSPITVAVSLNMRLARTPEGLGLPEERVIVG